MHSLFLRWFVRSFCPLEDGEIKLDNGICRMKFGYLQYLIITNIVILTIIIAASYTSIYLKVMRYKLTQNSLIHKLPFVISFE